MLIFTYLKQTVSIFIFELSKRLKYNNYKFYLLSFLENVTFKILKLNFK